MRWTRFATATRSFLLRADFAFVALPFSVADFAALDFEAELVAFVAVCFVDELFLAEEEGFFEAAADFALARSCVVLACCPIPSDPRRDTTITTRNSFLILTIISSLTRKAAAEEIWIVIR